jgi:hypothetical protein
MLLHHNRRSDDAYIFDIHVPTAPPPPFPFRRLFSVLRPGGRLLITDYCKAEGKRPSEGFAAYIQQRGYDLHSIDVSEGA